MFPIWPTYAFAGVAALALYFCFASIWGWWPTTRAVRGPSAGATAPSAANDDATNETAGVTNASAAESGAAPAALDHGSLSQPTGAEPELTARLDRISTLTEVAPQHDSEQPPSLGISGQEQKESLFHARESLKREKFILEFEDDSNLLVRHLHALLDDYHAELVRGNLSGFAFASSQIVTEWGSEYRRARELYFEYQGRESLHVRGIEHDLVEGVRILLDITFIQEKQTHFSVLAISNFARLMYCRSIGFICSRLPQELGDFESFREFSGNPLSSSVGAARFYGRDVRLMDLWDPKYPRQVLKLWLPRDGYAGRWFFQGNYLPPDSYSSHYHPPEHYGYVLPQAVARFLSNGDPIPTNFFEYMLGPS